MSCALRRYDACLALMAARDGTDAPFVPPLDCAWLWHCHKLNPRAYAADCQARFGRLVDATGDAFAFSSVGAVDEASEAAWRAAYPGVPFLLDLAAPSAGLELLPAWLAAAPPLRSSVAACAARQSDFLWSVSGEAYGHPAFLSDGVRRYRQMLQLMALHPRGFIVPAYDMDLVWHSHCAHPGAYARDTTAIVGCTVHHDDTVTDRAEGSKLSRSTEQTRELWASAFPGESWAKPGAMWPGPPPPFYHAAEPRWRGGAPAAESYAQGQPVAMTMTAQRSTCCWCCEEVRMVPTPVRANPAYLAGQPQGVMMQPQPVMMQQPGVVMMQQPGVMMVNRPMMVGPMYGGNCGGMGVGVGLAAGAVLGAELAMASSCGGFGGGFGGGSCGGGGCGGGGCGGGW